MSKRVANKIFKINDEIARLRGEARLTELAAVYEQLPGEAAREVAGWLRGEYTFDPACLTD
jgi:hypothetical protein